MNYDTFVTESNRIESILRPPTDDEVSATRAFVEGDKPTVESLTKLALVYTSGRGLLRDKDSMNVRVGSHIAPRGGLAIRAKLEHLLSRLDFQLTPYEFHIEYETLHPFLDGNGRTGRALWAWQMYRVHPHMLELGFLHAWYYQTLDAQRA